MNQAEVNLANDPVHAQAQINVMKIIVEAAAADGATSVEDIEDFVLNMLLTLLCTNAHAFSVSPVALMRNVLEGYAQTSTNLAADPVADPTL